MFWTQSKIEQLKREMASPHYTSAFGVAEKLGTTRNAVLGYCHRHGIEVPQSKYNGTRDKRSRQARSEATSLGHFRASIPQPKPRSTEPEDKFIPLVARSAGCQWPEGDKPPYKFCGEKVFRGCYCEKHALASVK